MVQESPSVLPRQVQYNDGAVAVKTSGGTLKTRKGQSEDEYQAQLHDFRTQGPLLQTDTFTTAPLDKEDIRLESLDKIARERLLHGVERLYYARQYDRVVANVDALLASVTTSQEALASKQYRALRRVMDELAYVRSQSVKALANDNTAALAKSSIN